MCSLSAQGLSQAKSEVFKLLYVLIFTQLAEGPACMRAFEPHASPNAEETKIYQHAKIKASPPMGCLGM